MSEFVAVCVGWVLSTGLLIGEIALRHLQGFMVLHIDVWKVREITLALLGMENWMRRQLQLHLAIINLIIANVWP